MKKILETMLAVMVLSLLACPEVRAASDGKCGDNITWTLDDAGNLLIEGTGPMYDYDYVSRNPSPWAYSGAVKTVKFSDGITHIGDDIFYACWEIKSVKIPASVTSIGAYSFDGCRGLTSIVLPEGLTTIADCAFADCEGLTSLTIPNSVTSIGESAFWGCKGLTTLTIPESVTSIGINAFSSCRGLTSIVVDENNTKFDSRDNSNAIIETASNTLIVGCVNTVIPKDITSIGVSAFAFCNNMTSVTIPAKVTSIGEGAFYGCSGLKELTCLAPNPPTCGDSAFNGVDRTKCTLYVLEESVNVYKIADQWKDFYNVVGLLGVDDITMDGDDAETLYDVYNMQGVKVGGGLRRADMSDALPHGIYIFVSPNATRKVRL